MIKQFLIGSLVLLVIDYFYLNLTSSYFAKQVLDVQKSPMQIDYLGAVVAYIFMSIGLYYFILKENKTPYEAFLLGLVIYMTFDGTNKAILKQWTWQTLLLDGIWGGVLFGLTTYITQTIVDSN